MRLFSALTIGAQSLYSHATALTTIADNLSNSNTSGFKAERPEFTDLLADSIGSLYSTPADGGDGSAVVTTSALFTQGALDPTGRELDLAIDGNGFFVVRDPVTNLDYYTRAGNFTTDIDGNLVTLTGEQILGFTTASPTTPVALNLSSSSSAASPTTTMGLDGNLDVQSVVAPAAAAPATFQELNGLSSFRTPIRVIDSLGEIHDITLHFFHSAALGWEAQAYVDGAEVGGTLGTPTQLGSAAMTFTSAGIQDPAGTPASMTITPSWTNGAAATPVAIDLSGLSSFASPSSMSAVTADGVIPGSVVGLEFGQDGTITTRLSNGETVSAGTLALAMVTNKDGLERIGDTKYQSSDAAGEITIAAPQSDGRGRIQGGALESSNVDPSRQFVDLIRFQRGYQAGSQVISTANEIINITLQLA